MPACPNLKDHKLQAYENKELAEILRREDEKTEDLWRIQEIHS